MGIPPGHAGCLEIESSNFWESVNPQSRARFFTAAIGKLTKPTDLVNQEQKKFPITKCEECAKIMGL